MRLIDHSSPPHGKERRCPFNVGYSKAACPVTESSLTRLLGHVRRDHGAIAWTTTQLQAACAWRAWGGPKP